jgi:hypothetical protein
MRKRNQPYYYSSDDCNCCITCCSPVIIFTFGLEKLLKCICCCPCYTDICCENIKKSIIPNEITTPATVPIQLDENISNRYFGRIWGIRN